RAPLRNIAPGDLFAVVGLVALSLALFGPHVLALSTFIGNSDRFNTFLNVRLLAVDAWQSLGRVPAWSDAMLLGVPIYGLHWTMLAIDPGAALSALLPAREVLRAAGYISAAHLVLAALAAYLLLRTITDRPFPAFVGAGLYVCTTFAIHRISQVDS